MPIWLTFAAIAVISILVLAATLAAHKARAARRDRTAEVWSQNEVEYQARDHLIPNLEETIKVYSYFQAGEPAPQAAPARQAGPAPQPVAEPPAAGSHRGPRRTFRRDRLAEAS